MEPHIVSKGEFAALCGVTKGRVSQWLDERKIDGEALVGVGRNARINVDVAKRQIAARMDPGQRFGNGLTTDLTVRSIPADAPAQSPAPLLPDPVRDPLDEQIKRAKLAEVKFRNRKAEEEERARAGRYVDAGESRRAVAQTVGEVLKIVEGSLSDVSTALSARFALPERDLRHALRLEFVEIRKRVAKTLRRQAEALPAEILDDTDAPSATAETDAAPAPLDA